MSTIGKHALSPVPPVGWWTYFATRDFKSVRDGSIITFPPPSFFGLRDAIEASCRSRHVAVLRGEIYTRGNLVTLSLWVQDGEQKRFWHGSTRVESHPAQRLCSRILRWLKPVPV